MSQPKKITHYSWRRRVSRMVIGGLGIYLIVVLSRNLMEVVSVEDRVEEAKRKVEGLESERKHLESKLELVESDEFVEQQIRDELMLAKEGETVVVIPQQVGEVGKVEKVEQEKQEDLANWQKWARVFGFL